MDVQKVLTHASELGVITVGGVKMFTSYTRVVGFVRGDDEVVVSHNQWDEKTGLHLAELRREAKKPHNHVTLQNLPAEQFQAALQAELSAHGVGIG